MEDLKRTWCLPGMAFEVLLGEFEVRPWWISNALGAYQGRLLRFYWESLRFGLGESQTRLVLTRDGFLGSFQADEAKTQGDVGPYNTIRCVTSNLKPQNLKSQTPRPVTLGHGGAPSIVSRFCPTSPRYRCAARCSAAPVQGAPGTSYDDPQLD